MPRTIRLASGLVLFAFVASHLTNHALGLVSLDAMGAGRTWFVFVWRSLPGTVALYGALAVHVGFALAALYRRRTLLRMPRSEAAQLVLGFAIPLLLVSHVVGTRVEDALTGSDTGYLEVIRTLWVQAPWVGARQSAALVIAWIHGCLGLHFWLGIRPWYRRAAPLLYAAALLVPVLALLGFSQAGKEVARLHAASPGLTVQAAPDEHAAAVLDRVRTAAYGG
ncbi:MAG: adenylate/guanylate cyclase domain-containing protein, partial [Pseudomonadota bacterium]|nr:adenylate/guanylate cyclase domain-containing protein [Pseudomonadota bacterium]